MTSERMAMADVWNKYANTAARKHGKPGRELRPKSLTLDMHSHVAVPRVAEIVTPHLKQSTDPLVADSTPETQALMAKQAADIRTRMTVEFKDSANKPMPLPAGVTPQSAAA